MRAGRLRHSVTLLTARRERGDYNEMVETWHALATVRADYEPVSDGERTRAAETAAVADARFRIRWSPRVANLGPLNRLKFGTRTFGIIGVKPIGHRDELEISAQARAE